MTVYLKKLSESPPLILIQFNLDVINQL